MVWKVKPTSSDEVLPKKAIYILRKLEKASNNNQRRRYNKILKDLKTEYPDKAHIIQLHFIDLHQKRRRKPKAERKPKAQCKPKTECKPKTLLQQMMSLSPEEKAWIKSWKNIQGR